MRLKLEKLDKQYEEQLKKQIERQKRLEEELLLSFDALHKLARELARELLPPIDSLRNLTGHLLDEEKEDLLLSFDASRDLGDLKGLLSPSKNFCFPKETGPLLP